MDKVVSVQSVAFLLNSNSKNQLDSFGVFSRTKLSSFFNNNGYSPVPLLTDGISNNQFGFQPTNGIQYSKRNSTLFITITQNTIIVKTSIFQNESYLTKQNYTKLTKKVISEISDIIIGTDVNAYRISLVSDFFEERNENAILQSMLKSIPLFKNLDKAQDLNLSFNEISTLDGNSSNCVTSVFQASLQPSKQDLKLLQGIVMRIDINTRVNSPQKIENKNVLSILNHYSSMSFDKIGAFANASTK